MDLFQRQRPVIDFDVPDGALENIVGVDVISADMQFDMVRRQDERRILFAGEFPSVQGHFPNFPVPAHGDEIPGVFLQWILLVGGNDIPFADVEMHLRTAAHDGEPGPGSPAVAVIDHRSAPAATRFEAAEYGKGGACFERQTVGHGKMSILVFAAAEQGIGIAFFDELRMIVGILEFFGDGGNRIRGQFAFRVIQFQYRLNFQ